MNSTSTDNKHDNHIDNPHSYVRKRTRATAEQLAVLEDTFAVNVSPNSKLRKQLAEQLNMSERSIQIWFQNRRAKVKHMQKRAQMQMQQAAIRAQLYHYHQQQFGMLSPYGAAPPATHPMLPLQPPSLYSQQGQPQSAAIAAAAAAAVASQQQQHSQQQGFFFPPPPYMRRMPVPRAQSVDAVSYYGHPGAAAGQVSGNTATTTSASELAARSSFPTPGPEPFLPDTSTTPPPHMSQHYTMAAAAAAAGGSWSVPPPNYSMLDNPSNNSMKLTRQSMPPYNPLSHTLMDDFVATTPTAGPGTPGAQQPQPHEFMTSETEKNLTDDFPDFVHGQMSPSPSPNREDKNASYLSMSHNDTNAAAHPDSTMTTATSNVEVAKKDDNSNKNSNGDSSTVATTTAMNEADMWIASPNINASLDTSGLSNNEDEAGTTATVNPSSLMMAGSSSNTPFEHSANCSYLNATTLTIGTWHRLKLQSSDLVCLFENAQNAFMWYITEGGCRFKVEIPVTSLVSIEHSTSIMSVSGEPTSDIHFYMSQPPLFYMETNAAASNNNNNNATETSASATTTTSNPTSTNTTTTTTNNNNGKETQWIQCSDFTENKQASRFLRHTLKGGSVQLKQDLMQLINEKEELRKFIHFLDDENNINNNDNAHSSSHFNHHTTIPSSTNAFNTTPFLPSQQQDTTMMLPSAAGTPTPYYPDSTYYCYPGMPTTGTMPPLPLPTNSSNTTSMVSSNESPVPCGGFYS